MTEKKKKKKQLVKLLSLCRAFGAGFLAFPLSEREDTDKSVIWPSPFAVYTSDPGLTDYESSVRKTRLEHNRLFIKQGKAR